MIVKYNLDLTEYNSYRVHSIAELAIFPESIEDFKEIISTYDMKKACVIGKGCNIIFEKDKYPASHPFIFIRENFSKIEEDNGIIRVLAGTDLKELSVYAQEHSLTGLEYFYDIPGCVGGAITMNAGSCGVSISDYITEITYMNMETGKLHIVGKDQLNLGYRESYFKDHTKAFILGCVFDLPKGDSIKIKVQMDEILNRRHSKQPFDYPNAGSVFIRPAENIYVGPMIEKLGLKGFRIGGAEVSTKHAGFIINAGNATGHDIVSLIEFIKAKVKAEYNVELKTEQRII